jgi:hypothetical protein
MEMTIRTNSEVITLINVFTTPLLCFAIAGVNVILLGPIPSFG